jgi:hypothetical protein
MSRAVAATLIDEGRAATIPLQRGRKVARVNFREIRERFTHIDARFVSCTMGFGGMTPAYTVSLYPWWEHPAVVEAVAAGKDWGSVHCDDGYRNLTVYPQGVAEFKHPLMRMPPALAEGRCI